MEKEYWTLTGQSDAICETAGGHYPGLYRTNWSFVRRSRLVVTLRA
jgi:hypothetical protein